MADLFIVFMIILIAGYTMLFGIQNLKEGNYLGFVAILALSLAIIALPVYLLFFNGN